MKHGIRPSRQQKKLLREWGLNWENWLIERDNDVETVIIHRYSGQVRRIPKREETTDEDREE